MRGLLVHKSGHMERKKMAGILVLRPLETSGSECQGTSSSLLELPSEYSTLVLDSSLLSSQQGWNHVAFASMC